MRNNKKILHFLLEKRFTLFLCRSNNRKHRIACRGVMSCLSVYIFYFKVQNNKFYVSEQYIDGQAIAVDIVKKI